MSKTNPITEALPKDANGTPIQIGNSFRTTDATASPQGSPLALTGSPQTIVIPLDAVEFIVNPSATMQVSEDPAMATYDVIAANTKESIPCAKMSEIYINGSGTLNFRFTMID